MKLTPAHKELIRLLASVAVEQFTEEQNSRARTMTPTRLLERNDDGNRTPIPEGKKAR